MTFAPKIIFYNIDESQTQTQQKVIQQTSNVNAQASAFIEESELFKKKLEEYNTLVQKYKLLKVSTKRLLTKSGVNAQREQIHNLYLLYNTIRQHYLRTMGYKKVKVILVNENVKNVVKIDIYKALDKTKYIRKKFLHKHETYKTLRKVRTVAGLKKQKLLPFATLNVKQADGSNKRRMLRKSQVQLLYVDKENNRLQLRSKRARRQQKYRGPTYYMLKQYQKYGKQWARQKFNKQYVKQTLKYIDLISTTRIVKIFDVFDIQKNVLYKIDQDGRKLYSQSFIGSSDLLITNYGLQQLAKFNNNRTLRLVRNVHSDRVTTVYEQTQFPEYYLILKINKLKYRRQFYNKARQVIIMKDLLKDYFSRLRQGKNNIIIYSHYYKYKQPKKVRQSGSTKILFGNNKQKVVGFNYTDGIKKQIAPYLQMENVPKQKRFKYKLRVLDYQILYNQPGMGSVFI